MHTFDCRFFNLLLHSLGHSTQYTFLLGFLLSCTKIFIHLEIIYDLLSLRDVAARSSHLVRKVRSNSEYAFALLRVLCAFAHKNVQKIVEKN